jgi:hypothetical protein
LELQAASTPGMSDGQEPDVVLIAAGAAPVVPKKN